MLLSNHLKICRPEHRSRALAACKPRESEPFIILKISWKSKPDPNMAIPLIKKISKQPNSFKVLRLSRGCQALIFSASERNGPYFCFRLYETVNSEIMKSMRVQLVDRDTCQELFITIIYSTHVIILIIK